MPVTSIYQGPSCDEIGYTDSSEFLELNIEQNEIKCCEKLPLAPNEKIIHSEVIDDQITYFTSFGNVYYNYHEGNSSRIEDTWSKLFYNDMYENVIKSLPPRRAGQLLPEYTKAIVSEVDPTCEVAFVGRGVLPFVYSFGDKNIIWKGKNVTNDELDLEVPANDVDLLFMHQNYHLVAAHAHNKIRVYDVRSRRRKPITDVTLNEIIKAEKTSRLTTIAKSSCEKYLYVGNDRGSIYELDVKKNFAISHKFKGITTSIRDIKVYKEHLIVASLDGYIRIFNTVTKEK